MFSADTLAQYRRDIAEHVPRSQQAEGENQHLVEAHLQLVVRIAWYYQRYGDLMDLIQEGNLGLLRAAQKFDPAQGVQFSTYAVWWIRQAILSSTLPQRQLLSVPMYKLERLQKLLRTQRQEEAAGNAPTLAQLAERMEISVASVLELFALEQGMHAVSINTQTEDSEDDTLAETLEANPEHAPEHVAELLVRNEQIQHLLAALTKDEREVIILRYGLRDGVEHSYEEIVKSTHLGSRRIHTLEQRAMLKMHHLAMRTSLQDFVA